MDQLSAFLEEFQKETDRAAAVLAVAYIDDRLKELLLSKFVGSQNFVEDLFSAERPLSSVSAKVSVAYAVGLVSLPVAQDLHLIRRIRNDFAHKVHGLSFRTPEITSRVNEIRILKALQTTDGKPIPIPNDARGRFNIAVALLLVLGIEARIRDMPAFQEALGGGPITAVREDLVRLSPPL
jgi:hypothetical protein